jgi:hypothetical protein
MKTFFHVADKIKISNMGIPQPDRTPDVKKKLVFSHLNKI